MSTPDRAALVQEARRRRESRACKISRKSDDRCWDRYPDDAREWCHVCLLAALVETEPRCWQPIETMSIGMEGVPVLVYDDGYIGKGVYENGRWLDTEVGREDAFFDPPPTHWMPLPAPPVTETDR